MKRSKKYLKFLLILIVVSSVIGIAYAYAVYNSYTLYYLTNRGVAVDFRVSVDKTSSITNMHSCLPEVGVNLDYEEFSVSGAGEMDHVYYEIDIVEENTSNLTDFERECIMVYLTDDEDQGMVPLTLYSDLEESENVNGRILTYGYFDKVFNKTFRIRTWVDSECYRNLDGKNFDYTIKVHAHK